jgi:hypothetical protein
VPFLVKVSGDGIEPAKLGPLDPDHLDDTLVLNVHARPRLTGVVSCGGKPVPEAEVKLSGIQSMGGGHSDLGFGESDEEGRFGIVYDGPGSCQLRAFVPWLGFGTLGPIEVDGVNDVDGLEIVLDQPTGTLVGRVTLPEGRRAEEVWLLASSGEGLRTLRKDGTYCIPDLEPGNCHVRICGAFGDAAPDEWIRNQMHDWPGAPAWVERDIQHQLDVEPGQTARLDIDLTAPIPVRLDGRVLVDGRGAQGPSQEVALRSAYVVSESERRPDGTFALGAHQPGVYTLHCELDLFPNDLTRWSMVDQVTLSTGDQSWTHDFVTGSIRVSRIGSNRPTIARWLGEGELRIEARYPGGDHEVLLFAPVPAGRVQLVALDAEEREMVVECVVRPARRPRCAGLSERPPAPRSPARTTAKPTGPPSRPRASAPVSRAAGARRSRPTGRRWRREVRTALLVRARERDRERSLEVHQLHLVVRDRSAFHFHAEHELARGPRCRIRLEHELAR